MTQGVTTCRQARPLSEPVGMSFIADIDPSRRALHLRMTFQAEIGITLHQQLPIDRAVRLMTYDAALAQRLMLEYERPRLLAVTLAAALVLLSHRQTAPGFENIL